MRAIAPLSLAVQRVLRRAAACAAAVLASSLAVLAQAPPAPPSNLTATVNGNAVVLSWTPGAGSSGAFLLEAGSAPGQSNLAAAPVNATSVTFTGVPPGTYFVRVRALNGGVASAPSNEATVVVLPPAVPGPPANLVAAVSGSTVSLTWSASSTGGSPSSYLVEAGSASGARNLAVVAVTARVLVASDVSPGTYYVRVRAVGAAGTSAPSNEAVAVVAPLSPPSAPANLTRTINGSSVSFSWGAPTGGGPPTGYVLEAGSSTGASNLGSVPVTGTVFTASAVPNGQYFARVRAVNRAGSSGPSNEVSFFVGPLPVPGAPQSTSVVVVDHQVFGGPVIPDQYQLHVSWTPPASGPAVTAGYVLEVGSAPGLSDVSRASVCTPTSACGSYGNRLEAVAIVPRAGTFYVRVRAAAEGGAGPAGNEVVASARVPVNGLPVSGQAASLLAAIDDAMTGYMKQRGIVAGAVAVSMGPRVFIERVYGWRNGSQKSEHLRSNAPFRLASVSKPITAAIVQRLATQGRLSLQDRAFCTGANQPCRLQVAPAGAPDPRLGAITIAHLLDHRAGWNRDLSGDPMFNLRAIAQQLGLPSPIGKNDIIRWLAGRPLDFAPGTDYAYSNVGYLVLGQIVEASTGRTFMDEARDLFAPFQHEGFAEIQLGRSLPADRLPYEPIYLDPYTTFSLFPPYGVVAWPDGGLLMEAFEAHGGLLASSAAIARFSSNFWLTGAPRTGNGQNWIAYGSMPGTLTMARQLPNGVNLVTLFNTRVDTANAIIDPETIRTLLEPIVLQINWSALDAK